MDLTSSYSMSKSSWGVKVTTQLHPSIDIKNIWNHISISQFWRDAPAWGQFLHFTLLQLVVIDRMFISCCCCHDSECITALYSSEIWCFLKLGLWDVTLHHGACECMWFLVFLAYIKNHLPSSATHISGDEDPHISV